jgi:hypothetical protein
MSFYKFLSVISLLPLIASTAIAQESEAELWPIASQEKDGYDGKPIKAFSPPETPQLIKVSRRKSDPIHLEKALKKFSNNKSLAKKSHAKDKNKLRMPASIDAKKDKATNLKRSVKWI